MKYIEELSPGDCFVYQNDKLLLTHDFKRNGQRLAYSLVKGSSCWLEGNCMVESYSIYGLDENNNLYPIKPIVSPNDILNSPQNIS